MRISRHLLLAILAYLTAGCETLGIATKDTPTAPSGPPAAGSAIVYSVVGASDAVGFGSSRPCLPFEDCDGTGYAWVAARQLRSRGFTVTIGALGIPGAVISRTFQDLAVQAGRTDVPLNLIQSAMPFVKKDATLVTVFTGGNDVNVITAALGKGFGSADPAAFIDQQVATFGTDFAALISGIRTVAPAARVVVINLPNLAGLPYMATATLAQKQAAQRAAVAMTTRVINPTADIRVIDLMCDARFYQSASFSADGFHPSDAGYAALGASIADAVTAATWPAPRSACAQMTLF